MNPRYQHSLALSARAEQSIPLGSQTFSKSRLCFPSIATKNLCNTARLQSTCIANKTN